jgi:hypothetical protein
MWVRVTTALRVLGLQIEVVEDEVTLRPTVSRPVRLGVLPLLEQVTRCYIYLSDNYFLYFSLAVPGHALLWLIPVLWKRKKRGAAHVSHMFNFTMLVGIQYYLCFLFCAAIEIVWFADPRTRNI